MAMTNASTRSAGALTGLPRLLPPEPVPSLAAHVARFGPLPRVSAALIPEIERAGLRGRGGAGFPTAVKVAAVATRSRGRAVVVANGTEGEPASAKDKTLLALVPHLVLDGVAAAAAAVGATEAIVCVERSATRAVAAVERAVAERRQAGADRVPVRVATTPSRYIAGEESALVHWLQGGEAKPTFTPPRPFERGVRGRPTLIQNVETLAHMALIARFGATWFRSVGTVDDPGSALVSVGGVPRRGVYEVALGTPLASVLRAAGSDLATDDPGVARPVLIGGYFGTWIPAGAVAGTTLSKSSLAAVGASLGCGVVSVLPADVCGLAESARVTRWLAGQTAGQCGPCVFGLDAIARAMEALVAGDRSGQAEQALARWLGMVAGRGACRHPDGAARFVASSLRVFAGDIARHRHQGPCGGSRRGALPLPVAEGWR